MANKFTDYYIILPSDKRDTPRFYQFGELTAEERFLFVNKNSSMCFTTIMCIDRHIIDVKCND